MSVACPRPRRDVADFHSLSLARDLGDRQLDGSTCNDACDSGTVRIRGSAPPPSWTSSAAHEHMPTAPTPMSWTSTRCLTAVKPRQGAREVDDRDRWRAHAAKSVRRLTGDVRKPTIAQFHTSPVRPCVAPTRSLLRPPGHDEYLCRLDRSSASPTNHPPTRNSYMKRTKLLAAGLVVASVALPLVTTITSASAATAKKGDTLTVGVLADIKSFAVPLQRIRQPRALLPGAVRRPHPDGPRWHAEAVAGHEVVLQRRQHRAHDDAAHRREVHRRHRVRRCRCCGEPQPLQQGRLARRLEHGRTCRRPRRSTRPPCRSRSRPRTPRCSTT